MRQVSRHASYMTIYGSSIEGRQLTTESVVRSNPKYNNKKEKKVKVCKKAQLIIANNNKKKLLNQETQERTLLADFEVDYKKPNKNFSSLLSKINLLVNKTKVPIVIIEVYIWKIKILLRILKDLKSSNDNKYYSVKKEIFITVRKTLSRQTKDTQLNAIQKEVLSDALQVINCCEIAKRNNLLSMKDDKDTGE